MIQFVLHFYSTRKQSNRISVFLATEIFFFSLFHLHSCWKEEGLSQSTFEWEEGKERAACLWRMGEFRENNDSYKLVKKNQLTNFATGGNFFGGETEQIGKDQQNKTLPDEDYDTLRISYFHLLLSRSATMDV